MLDMHMVFFTDDSAKPLHLHTRIINGKNVKKLSDITFGFSRPYPNQLRWGCLNWRKYYKYMNNGSKKSREKSISNGYTQNLKSNI